MRQVFSGTVELGDAYRCYTGEEQGAIRIGGVDVVDEIMEGKYAKPTRVYINDELVADGLLSVSEGWGYSGYTPIDSDEFDVVGGTIEADMIHLLTQHEDKAVKLVVTDEDEDVLEPVT